jgi:glyoxylase-like metal-dependent hydrolase (beta-lactamase superfamily II)
MRPRLKLYLFSCGTLVNQGFEAPVPFFLIRHPEGDVVIDGGNPLPVARDAQAYWGPLAAEFDAHMTEQDHCAAQLARVGGSPDSVRHVVQTHLHMDHTGALGHFPAATVVVHGRELEAARSVPEPAGAGYVHADYDRSDVRWRELDGDLDLFEDGTIRLLETPGHSAGHMSVLLALEETGPVLLTADAVDVRAQWEGRLALRAFFSREQAERSLERLRAVAEETEPLLVFGHDPRNWGQLVHAPDCYA